MPSAEMSTWMKAHPECKGRMLGTFGLMFVPSVALTYIGYQLLRGRFPFAGLVGGLAGFFVLSKIASPITKPIVESIAKSVLGPSCTPPTIGAT